MNLYETRHAILHEHIGEKLTPAQLKTELLERFPSVKPQSVNASDCHYSERKRAGSTCPECGKLGGFAVNRDGIVDMGASGWGKISSVYVPTGHRRILLGTAGLTPTRPGDILRISPRDGTQCVEQYNASSYRGRINTALDKEAYKLFNRGLSNESARLVDQIAFVGEQYGGAQERFGSIRKEAALIVARLHPILDEWLKVEMEAKPLTERVPDQATIDFLFSPFLGTKQWPVWASKTLHFLRPNVFPILDSNAKKALGLKSMANSSRNYHFFSAVFRDVLLANAEGLAAARVADGRESPTDLKVLDKILFQLGLHMS